MKQGLTKCKECKSLCPTRWIKHGLCPACRERRREKQQVRGRDNRDEIKANANLVAAAPDLLSVCTDLLRILDAHQFDDKLLLYRNAQEAVKKARGENDKEGTVTIRS